METSKLGVSGIPSDNGPCVELEVFVNTQTPQLLQHLFELLRALARENPIMQAMLLQHADLFLSYLSVPDVDAETVLTAALSNNADNIKKKGKEWCKIILGEVIKHGRLKSVHLELIISMLSCNREPVKDLQDFVRAEIQSSPELENMLVPSSIMAESSDVSQFDPVKDVKSIRIEANCLVLLARVCEGKNPASNVFAERFVSLEWLINSIVRIPLYWNNVDTGQRYKWALLACLRHVYLQADFTSIEHQIKLLETGFWTLDAGLFPDACHCQPVIPMVQRELLCFSLALTSFIESTQPRAGEPDTMMVSEHAEVQPEIESENVRALTTEYMTLMISCLKLLRDYYRLPPFEMPERSRHYRVSQELLCQVQALYSLLQEALSIRQSAKGTITSGFVSDQVLVKDIHNMDDLLRKTQAHAHGTCSHKYTNT
jgi:hypothetical protein